MLEMKNVSGGYGKRIVVSEINALFSKGEITSVIGANGCGKSTLLMLAAGLITCDTGTILADGEDISKLSRNVLARKLSYLPQMKNPGSISVRSLVSHGRFPYLGYPRRYTAEDKRKVDEAMSLAGVSELADRNFGELSGGQQQRVRIAMTLAQDTDIILLDEPMTYLDIRHKLEVSELIGTLREMGKTIVAVMHDLDIAFACSDKIAVMNGGRLTAFDLPEAIAKSKSFEDALGVRALYSGEFGRYFFVK
ncbi:MAG: ABC transporter ATP-binding protein [Oscillospiraceae bacterium]|nr:ABC transporter ATP-binding protein [Oscillospiraceae bacterium]